MSNSSTCWNSVFFLILTGILNLGVIIEIFLWLLTIPNDVQTYLDEELQHWSFMKMDKNGSPNQRVIVNLSWPKDTSVNKGIDKDS